MEKSRRFTFRPAARIGVVATSLAAVAVLLFPNVAFASTQTIGSVLGNTPNPCALGSGADSVQATTSIGASYAVPAGGTSITSWNVSDQAKSTGSGPVALEVWRPTTAAPTTPPTLTVSLVRISAPVTLPSTLPSFALVAPIPVLPGDLIGLRLEASSTLMCLWLTGNPSDKIGFHYGNTLSVESMGLNGGFQLNVAATVEVTPPLPPLPPTTCAAQCQFSGEQEQVTDCQGPPPQNQGNCVDATGTQSRNQGSSVTTAPPRGRQSNNRK